MQIKKQSWSFGNVQSLCTCGLMIALYIVLSLFNIRISDTLEIRIGFLAFIAAGMIGGPVAGFATGFLGDMLNCFIRGFAYFPGFSLSYGLVGALCGLILYKARPSISRVVGCAFVEYIISITLTSAWLYLMYGTPLNVLLTSRLIKCTLNFFVNIVIIYVFVEALHRIVRQALPAQR
ncbi:MAG: folate family ECF transporter S component [Eubacteriales bacterium]|nr:folate family ECF transporter S component [Eubacteriales bacterium]